MLRESGVPAAPVARLVVGSGDVRDFELHDILPVYLARRARLDAAPRRAPRRPDAARWGDPRVARLRPVRGVRARGRGAPRPAPRRRHPRAQRAAACTRPASPPSTTWPRAPSRCPASAPPPSQRLRAQARLQLEQERDRRRRRAVRGHRLRPRCDGMPAPCRRRRLLRLRGRPAVDRAAARRRGGSSTSSALVEVDGRARRSRAVLGARPRARSGRRSIDFLDWLAERRRALTRACTSTTTPPTSGGTCCRLAARHGVGEDEVDELLRDGVFVDLYAVVRAALRVVAALVLASRSSSRSTWAPSCRDERRQRRRRLASSRTSRPSRARDRRDGCRRRQR